VVTVTQHIHTLHFLQGDGGVDGEDLINAWETAAQTAYRNCFSVYSNPNLELEAKMVAGVGAFPSPDIITPIVANRTGTRDVAGSDFMPSFMAALVTEKGSLAGRRYSGRFFLGGLYEADCSANTMNAGYITLVQAYCNALKTAFVTPALPAWRLFCYSKLLGEGDPNHTKRNPIAGQPRLADPVTQVAPQLAGSAVRDLVPSTRPTTMRSRKLGHGS
jgi:hypothetical protein